MRVQGWDPVLIICQIISLQTIHYLTLALLLPPLLAAFTTPSLLEYSGGPQTVAHIIDWRELASRPTITESSFTSLNLNLDGAAGNGWRKLRGAWSGGKVVGEVESNDSFANTDADLGATGRGGAGGAASIAGGQKGLVKAEEGVEVWDFGVDDKRGWMIGLAWLIASAVDIAPLYYLIRRPTYILDFSLTLVLIHLILTTYFSGSFPTSIYFWVIQALGALLMIVIAEQMCVKREMHTELDMGWDPDREQGEVIELNDR